MHTDYNKIKSTLILLISFILSLFIVGCSAKDKTNKIPEKVNISFTWWGTNERHNYTKKGIEVYTRRNPFINIQFSYSGLDNYEEEFDDRFKKDREADVMLITYDMLGKYSPNGIGYYDLYKLDDYISLTNFTQTDIFYGERNGRLNAIPIAYNAILPVYNKDLFDSNNLKLPKNWDELFTCAKILGPKGYYLYGLNENVLLLLTIAYFEQNTGKRFFTNYETLNTTVNDLELCLDFLQKAFAEKVFSPEFINFEKNTEINNNIASVFGWCTDSSKYSDFFESKKIKAVLGDYIHNINNEEYGWYIKPAYLYAIKKNTKHPLEAARFLDFLINDADMARLQGCEKGIPNSNAALTAIMASNQFETKEYEAIMKMRFHYETINMMLPVMENKEIVNIFINNLQQFLNGTISKNQCAANLYNQIRKVCPQ